MKMWFYAIDKQQHGPVSVEEIGNLLAAKTVTPETFVWTEGMGNWADLEDVHELAHLLSDSPATGESETLPTQTLENDEPDASPQGEDTPEEDILETKEFIPSKDFSVKSILADGWLMLKNKWLNLLILCLLWVGITFAFQFIHFSLHILAGKTAAQIITWLAIILFSPALLVGSWALLLRMIDGEPLSVNTIFSRFKNWQSLFLTHLIFVGIILTGTLALVIPGVIAFILLNFWPAICADRLAGTGPWAPLKKSYELTRPHLATLILLLPAFVLIKIAGLLLFVVGIIPATLLIMSCITVTYRKLVPKAV